MKNSNFNPKPSDARVEIEDYGLELRQERREAAQHYLKPFRQRILLCWVVLAVAFTLAAVVNTGWGMLLAFAPVVYLRSIYTTAYSPGHYVSRGRAIRSLLVGIPLSLYYLLAAGGLTSTEFSLSDLISLFSSLRGGDAGY